MSTNKFIGFVGVREEPINDEVLRKQIAHDYRDRKDLENVNYDLTSENITEPSKETLLKRMQRVRVKHDEIYFEKYKRKIRQKRTRSFRRGVIFLSAIFQEEYKQGKFSKADVERMLKDFIKKYEEKTGRKILGYSIHFDEKTLHCHYFGTNFNRFGVTRNKKGTGEFLQDIAGESFAEIKARRGISKEETKAVHKNPREHYIEVLQQAEVIEQKLEAEMITAEEVQNLADYATKPLKTLLIYVKRALELTADAEKIFKNQNRAMNKLKEAIPQINNIEDFNELIEYIAANKQQLKTKNFKPQRS